MFQEQIARLRQRNSATLPVEQTCLISSFQLLYMFGNSRLADKQLNPEKPDVPLNKNDAFQKVQKRRVQEKR